MAVLYRKYRPQTFSEVLNQKYIIQTLKNQVAAGQVAHAYLFTGSRGVGKTSVARILAKAVNCQKPKDGEACGKCDICTQISNNNFLDLIEIDAASNTGVDNIRDLIEHVKFSPSSGKYKVFIIDEVHMLSKGAFNALLKTLEEPPAHAIFVLATTEINKVPPTIISRTQRFDFKRLGNKDIAEHLTKILKEEKVKFASEIVTLIAENAEGSVRDALSLLDKVLTLGEEATLEDCQHLLGITDTALCYELVGYIINGDGKSIPDFFSKLLEKGIDFSVFNRDFLEYLRKALIYKITQAENEFFEGHAKELVNKVSAQDLIFTIRLFLKSYKDLSNSPSAEIPLLIASLEAALKKNSKIEGPSAKEDIKSFLNKSLPPALESAFIEIAQTELVTVQTIQSNDNSGSTVTMAEVQEFWPKVIVKIREVNSPLANLLKTSPLHAVDGSKVLLSVKFLFHKQNLENAKNASVISKVIEDICGKNLRVSGHVLKEESVTTNAGMLNDALKIFGGELIE